MLSDRASVYNAVHVVFVNRGNSPGGLRAALRSMSNVHAWALRPERLRFHLLADEQHHGAISGMATLGTQAGLPLTVHNASDAALRARLPPLGLATLRHTALQGKPRLYTAPKLFLHALLDMESVLVIDTDILMLADVCELWDAWIAHTSAEPRTLLGYAREQQVARPELRSVALLPTRHSRHAPHYAGPPPASLCEKSPRENPA